MLEIEELERRAKELRDKRAVNLTGKKLDQFDTEEKRQDLRKLSRRKEIWTSFMFVSWLLAAFLLFVYSNLAELPHPDLIRKEGILHEATITERHFPKPGYTGSNSKHSGGSYVGVTLDDGRPVKEII